ncbi:hypothetical protein, partial [Amycolatopsis pithecellobii]
MVATRHTRSSPPALRVGDWNSAGNGENHAIESLLQHAAALGLRAPELTVVLGERAASLAETAASDMLWARAESLVVSGRVRLGLRADSVGRGVAALRAAEDLGDTVLAAGLRTDLALCARSAGVPLIGLAALRPVLGASEFSGAGKASALCQLVGSLSQFGRKPELDRALVEADRLCGTDDNLDGDERLLGRALVRVAMSAHRRRHADVVGAADAARTGLGLLDQLDDPSCDGGVVRSRLILHLVCSLLDRGDTENAAEIAESELAESTRAAAVAPFGWLRMAVATRILLPAGSVEAASVVLRDAVYSTERHGLYALTSRLWAELAHVEERLGRSRDAIECLRQSRAADHVYARSRRQAMGLLAGAFGNGGQATLDLDELLGAVAESSAEVPQAAPVRVVNPAGVSAGRNGGTVSPDALGADQSGRGTPEPEVAERTVIIPRIVDPGGDRRSVTTSRREVSANGTRRAEETVVLPVAGKRTETAKPRVKLAPVRLEPPVVPDLPLAPPPADEPAPRVAQAAERKPELVVSAGNPEDDQIRPKTRHTAEHGSVAARSVLDRLGISAGSGGGRRRATDDHDQSRQNADSATAAEPRDSSDSARAVARANAAPSGTRGESAQAAMPMDVARPAAHGETPRPVTHGEPPQVDAVRTAEQSEVARAHQPGKPWVDDPVKAARATEQVRRGADSAAGAHRVAAGAEPATAARADFAWSQGLGDASQAEAVANAQSPGVAGSAKQADTARHAAPAGSARVGGHTEAAHAVPHAESPQAAAHAGAAGHEKTFQDESSTSEPAAAACAAESAESARSNKSAASDREPMRSEGTRDTAKVLQGTESGQSIEASWSRELMEALLNSDMAESTWAAKRGRGQRDEADGRPAESQPGHAAAEHARDVAAERSASGVSGRADLAEAGQTDDAPTYSGRKRTAPAHAGDAGAAAAHSRVANGTAPNNAATHRGGTGAAVGYNAMPSGAAAEDVVAARDGRAGTRAVNGVAARGDGAAHGGEASAVAGADGAAAHHARSGPTAGNGLAAHESRAAHGGVTGAAAAGGVAAHRGESGTTVRGGAAD